MKKFYFVFLIAAILVCIESCDNPQVKHKRPMHEAKRAMYHWKNTCNLSHEETAFLKRHKIGRLYIRFFDVTLENLLDGKGVQAIPTASVRFEDDWRWNYNDLDLPEIVPTVFITPEAVGNIYNNKQTPVIVQKMLERIDNMRSFYNIPKDRINEIQLDCDWTTSTEQAFFRFCKEVRRQMSGKALLSSTIRLHQLQRPAPPVDYGVLMLYNTNNLRDPSVENSILSANDVKPYLRKVHYDLPLDLAYPTFAWDLWFQNGKFCCILRSERQADSLRQAGEMVRHEEVSFDEIMKVKRIVETCLPKPKHNRSIILYHLDRNNIKRYSDHEIETIYSR